MRLIDFEAPPMGGASQKVWINPEHVVSVEHRISGPPGAPATATITLVGGKAVGVLGEAREVANYLLMKGG